MDEENGTAIQTFVVVDDMMDHQNDKGAPNGGFTAWLQVAVSFMIHFVVIGIASIFGVFQEAYTKEAIFFGTPTIYVTLVGAAGTLFLFIFGPISGYICAKFGYRHACASGAVIMTLGLSIGALSTEFWHLIVTQGILFGIGANMAWVPSLAIISHWFDKRKGLAMGISVAGGGVGGLTLAPLTRFLITVLGWPSTLVIISCGCGFILLVSAYFMQTRLPPAKHKDFDFPSFLRDSRFLRYFFIIGCIFWGYFIPVFFLSLYAVDQGMTPTQGALIIALLNAGSSAGRLTMGICADYLGHIKMLSLCLYVSAISVLIIWPFSTTFGMLSFFSVIFGFFIGGAISIAPTGIVDIFGTKHIGTITGMIYPGGGVGNFAGPLISAWLLDKFTSTPRLIGVAHQTYFLPVIILNGCILLIGGSISFSFIKWGQAGKHH